MARPQTFAASFIVVQGANGNRWHTQAMSRGEISKRIKFERANGSKPLYIVHVKAK